MLEWQVRCWQIDDMGQASQRNLQRTSERHLEAVVVVHHGGDAIKAVAIELVLLQPPAGIGEQEAQRLPVACSSNTDGISE